MLTHQTLQRCHHIWRKKTVTFINHGGLKACVYLLQRAKVKNVRNKKDEQEGGGDVDEDEGMDEGDDDIEEQGEMEST